MRSVLEQKKEKKTTVFAFLRSSVKDVITPLLLGVEFVEGPKGGQKGKQEEDR